MASDAASQHVRRQMILELAGDQTFLGYDHDPNEIAQVVVGLARAAGTPPVEYVASGEDVAAVARFIAYHLGVNEFAQAGELAAQAYPGGLRLVG